MFRPRGVEMAMTGPGTITVDVQTIDQLFSDFDPTPFHDESLNAHASEYLESEGLRLPPKAGIVIALAARDQPATPDDVERFRSVLKAHFGHQASLQNDEFHLTLTNGLKSLAIGLTILAACTAASQGLAGAPIREGLRQGLSDGISMLGWVANWRPIELLFYDWWPIKRRRDLYRRLAAADVRPEGAVRSVSSSP